MDEMNNVITEKEVVIKTSIQELTLPNPVNNQAREVIITVPKTEIIESPPKTIIKKEMISQEKVIDLTQTNITKNTRKNTKDKLKEIQLSKLDILKKLSSGTGLREGIDNIVSGGMGALVLVENPNSLNVFQGGFKINCKFNSKKLFELAKMDGAIILSEDFKKILYANTLLTPNRTITTNETGTRHQAAERTAKQTGSIVIAVSQRIGKITIYFGNSKYVLQNTEELLRRATETIQILEKQREVFDELITNLNLLEINNMVSVADVCQILERLEMIRKMTNIINEYIVELGKEGIILRMRMRELTKGVDKTQDLILKDYFPRPTKVRQFFDSLPFDGLLDLENIAKVLFVTSLENSIIPKGYRILSKTHFDKDKIEVIVRHFKNIDGIFGASRESMGRTLKANPEPFIKELQSLREHILVGKNI